MCSGSALYLAWGLVQLYGDPYHLNRAISRVIDLLYILVLDYLRVFHKFGIAIDGPYDAVCFTQKQQPLCCRFSEELLVDNGDEFGHVLSSRLKGGEARVILQMFHAHHLAEALPTYFAYPTHGYPRVFSLE